MSIRGTAELVNSREKIEGFWNIGYEKMLNTTSDDPDLILIKVNAETVEYWEVGNWNKSALAIIKRLTGNDVDSTNINNQIDLRKN